ncbi:hypothetical protein CPAV1605_749 [seawater metagenome]|uniref:Haloacid dehalogenase-like hydrolase n=1 Tax=seawater metagenome TaxID=1561972 RepID=A0A5E8CK35_9ZZZZ
MDKINILVTDFDGVMTDGKRYVNETGIYSKCYNMKDGLAIKNFQKLGIKIMILSGDNSDITQKIGNRLNVDYIKIGIKNKYEELTNFLKNNSLSSENIIYIGDDLNDKECLDYAKYKFTPKDGNKALLRIENIIQLESKGGEGCLSELYNFFNP